MEVHEVSKGNLNASIVRASEMFRAAVKANAASILLAQNHSPGNRTLSARDAVVTSDLLKAGQLPGMDVLDSMIIGHPAEKANVRLKEHGTGFE